MRFLSWLRRPDIMGVPGWLYLALWTSVAFWALCLFAPVAILLGW